MHIKKSDVFTETKTTKKQKNETLEKVLDKLNDKPTDLSMASKKLIKKANNMIEEAWAETKKNPYFVKTIKTNKKISLTPVYTNGKRLVLQIEYPDNYKRITVDERGTNFTYENVVKTEFGSATTKTYNSKTSKPDIEITKMVNELLEENLSKLSYQDNAVKE